jgi:uncharacterized protein YdbL (DUF1318 family)
MISLVNKLDALVEKINKKRAELYEIASTNKMTRQDIVKVSQELDSYIIAYQKCVGKSKI